MSLYTSDLKFPVAAAVPSAEPSAAPVAHSAPDPVPLVVDLDGTLIKTDLLVESVVRLLRRNLLYLILLPFWLIRGKQAFKGELAKRVNLDIALLPYHPDFLDYLRRQHAAGRTLVLATASHTLPARAVALHLGIFSQVLATDAERNLAGVHKLHALLALFGTKGFDYAGNASPDLAIWPCARRAILVNPERGIEARARGLTEVEAVFSDRKPLLKVIVRAIRVHQWLKNLLVFLPLIGAHAWGDPAAILLSLLAFAAFSLCASAIYLINDALDLDSDRAHSRKRFRPLAAGDFSLLAGGLLMPLLLAGGLAIGAVVSLNFLLVLLLYVLATCAYSFALKSYVLIDVLLLAALYTLRVIGGAAAIDVFPSFWLMALSMLLFTSLALVKRCAELESLRGNEKDSARGRDYHVFDLPNLTSLGTSTATGAAVILALYINSPDVAEHYRTPQALWLLCPLLMYWTGRMWLITGRGEMHDDPIIYSARDKPSWVVAGLGLLLILIAV